MTIKYICTECNKKYDPASLIVLCECGGMLDVERINISFSKEDIMSSEWSLFRYLKALPIDSDS
ncbi:MAG: hypothetical protein ACLKAK_01135 [Alkaliphilus sp.]